jgi:hypothetical protein
MTTEKKVASKAIPSKTSSTAAVKPARKTPVRRRTTTAKTAVNRTTQTTATKTAAKPKTTPTVQVVNAKQKKTEKKAKPSKEKSSKVKMERDSFTMPKDEYSQLASLKARLLALGQPAKKSELLRAGIKLLSGMTDQRLKTTMAAIPVIKTGRPKKKK